jgi:hypothetical protein
MDFASTFKGVERRIYGEKSSSSNVNANNEDENDDTEVQRTVST